MKKLLSITLLLLSIAAPSATYSFEAPHNIQKASVTVETKKADNLKRATLKRRFCANLLVFLIVSLITISGAGWLIMMVLVYKNEPWGSGEIDEKLWEGLPAWVKNPSYEYLAYHISTYLLLKLSRYILGIKIVDISGEEATWKQQMIRYSSKIPPSSLLKLLFQSLIHNNILVTIATPAIPITNIFTTLWYLGIVVSTVAAEDGRGFPDRMANTVVVEA